MGKTVKFVILLGMIFLFSNKTLNAQSNEQKSNDQIFKAEIQQALMVYDINKIARACLKTIKSKKYSVELISQARKKTNRRIAVIILKCALEKLDREGKTEQFENMQEFITIKLDAMTLIQLNRKIALINNENKTRKKMFNQKKRRKNNENGFKMYIEDSLKKNHTSSLRSFEAIF